MSALKVLVAEDNDANRKLIIALLEKWGHVVASVSNGNEALAALEREPYDVVLMDIQMPELDGMETTRRIRERERAGGGHLPIIAMTAHAMKGDREKCLAAGMDEYVPKPVTLDRLHVLLERLGTSRP